jgi:hypothetical protein
MARTAASLRVVSVVGGVTALSDGNPSLRADLGDLASTLAAWMPVARDHGGLPVLILSPDGMRLGCARRSSAPTRWSASSTLRWGCRG